MMVINDNGPQWPIPFLMFVASRAVPTLLDSF